MGRAQVKYRATHGRGRGRGAGAPRGRGGARPSGVGGRSLGSNAFRYEEREEEEEEEEEADATASSEALSAKASGRRQFFADEKNYRPATRGAAAGSYFQSQTVRQWESSADDDEDPAFGVMDFGWLAEQLARVPPAIRYRMDPKDCVDFPSFEPVQDDAEGPGDSSDIAVNSLLGDDAGVAVDATVASVQAPTASSIRTDEEALDSLLELSASAATATSARVGGGSAPTAVARSSPPMATASQAQMEDWLDDVLDM